MARVMTLGFTDYLAILLFVLTVTILLRNAARSVLGSSGTGPPDSFDGLVMRQVGEPVAAKELEKPDATKGASATGDAPAEDGGKKDEKE